VLLKKISIPTQANGRRDYWKFQGGGGGGVKSQVFKEKYIGKLGFSEGLEGQTKTTLKGRRRGIFWKNTL